MDVGFSVTRFVGSGVEGLPERGNAQEILISVLLTCELFTFGQGLGREPEIQIATAELKNTPPSKTTELNYEITNLI